MTPHIFARESFSEFYPNALPLLERAYTEIEQDDRPFRLNDALYSEHQTKGLLRIWTARALPGTEDYPGDLLGYAAFLLFTHPHGRRESWLDVFYVLPEHRAHVGVSLLRFCERELEREGTERICVGARPAFPHLGEILRHMDYLPIETIYGKDVN